jgi:hypothetical protein
MKAISIDRKRRIVTIELAFEDVDWIACEMPQQDGFTKDWQRLVWMPVLDADLESTDRVTRADSGAA